MEQDDGTKTHQQGDLSHYLWPNYHQSLFFHMKGLYTTKYLLKLRTKVLITPQTIKNIHTCFTLKNTVKQLGRMRSTILK